VYLSNYNNSEKGKGQEIPMYFLTRSESLYLSHPTLTACTVLHICEQCSARYYETAFLTWLICVWI